MLTVSTFIVLLYLGILITGVLLLSKALPYRRRTEIRWLVVFIIAMCVVAFCSLNVYVQESIELKSAFSRYRFLGLSILGQAWFFFLLFSFSKKTYLHKSFMALLSLMPAFVTMLFVLVPEGQSLITKDYTLFAWQGSRLVKFSPGAWFPVHFYVSNFFAISSIIFSVVIWFRLDALRRKQLGILTVGAILSLSVDIYCVVTNSPWRWAMLSAGTFLLTEFAIFYAVIWQGLLDISTLAKDQIFKELPDPVLILDEENRVVDFNNAARKLFHLDEKNRYFHIKNLELFSKVQIDLEAQEIEIYDQQKVRHYFYLTRKCLHTKNSVSGAMLLFRQITIQKEIEEKLSDHLEFKARLLSLITHDFSGLIQTQSLLSSHLEREVQPELRSKASLLAEATFTSKELLSNILLWVQSQENQFKPLWRAFEIHLLIKNLIESLQGVLEIKNLQINVHSPLDHLFLNGDTIMIESILRNLLMNAIRASFKGQNIEVRVVLKSSYVDIHIQDYGSGMSQEQLQAVQQNIQKNPIKQETRNGGFGIGLSIARKFIELHSGKLEFQSQLGKGTLVTLSLPLEVPSC